MAQIKLYATIGDEIREFTPEEYIQSEIDLAAEKKAATAKVKAEQALADKRQIILDRLGITADELKIILP